MKTLKIAIFTLFTAGVYAGVVCWKSAPEVCHQAYTSTCHSHPELYGSFKIVEGHGLGSVCAQATQGHWGCANLLNVKCDWLASALMYSDEHCQDLLYIEGPHEQSQNKAKKADLSGAGCPDVPVQ